MRIAALIVVVLAGCAAPGGELADARGSWDGATYDEVVLRWGAPARAAASWRLLLLMYLPFDRSPQAMKGWRSWPRLARCRGLGPVGSLVINPEHAPGGDT